MKRAQCDQIVRYFTALAKFQACGNFKGLFCTRQNFEIITVLSQIKRPNLGTIHGAGSYDKTILLA